MDEQLTELEKLQQAAQLIEEMSQGRLLVRPSVAGLVYIRPQEDSNLGMDMRINSIPGQPRYRVTFAVQLRRMGTDMDADGLRTLLIEVGQLYALLAALEARSYTPTLEDLTAFRDGLTAQQEQEIERHGADQNADIDAGAEAEENEQRHFFAEDVAEQTQRQRRGLDELIQKEQRQHDRDGGNKALEIAEKAVRMDA